MKLEAVHVFLRSLSPGLKAMGASKTILNNLDKLASLFEPFRQMKFQAFQTLLTQVEEYYRTGTLPVVPTKGRGKRGSSARLDLAELTRKIVELQQRADRRAEPYEQLGQAWESLGTNQLKKAQWEPIAKELGIDLPRTAGKPARAKLVREAVFRNYPKPVPPEVKQALEKLKEVESFARYEAVSEKEVKVRFDQLALQKLSKTFLQQICDYYQISHNRRSKSSTLAKHLFDRVKTPYKTRAGRDA